MSKERVDIIVPDPVLAQNDEKRARLEKTRRFEATDRVPVLARTSQWFELAARGRTPADYLRGSVENLREQILNFKWRVESLRDDLPVPSALSLTPDLGCLRATEFPMDVTWSDTQPPKCDHPLKSEKDVDALAVPAPDSGINGTRIEWYHVMCRAVSEFDVRLNGEPVSVRIDIGQPGGPIPSAFALAGANLFLWMAADPERAHHLLDICTTIHLQCIRFFDELTGRSPKQPVGMGGDAAEMLSPASFREFVVPYYQRVWEAYPGWRGLHMCGKIDHLLEILRDELRIASLDSFGFPVTPEYLAEALSGTVLLSGGPHPMLIKDGPMEATAAECRRYLSLLGPKGGYFLEPGGGAAVGTPLAHLEAMVEESRRMGSAMREPIPHAGAGPIGKEKA